MALSAKTNEDIGSLCLAAVLLLMVIVGFAWIRAMTTDEVTRIALSPAEAALFEPYEYLSVRHFSPYSNSHWSISVQFRDTEFSLSDSRVYDLNNSPSFKYVRDESALSLFMFTKDLHRMRESDFRAQLPKLMKSVKFLVDEMLAEQKRTDAKSLEQERYRLSWNN